MVSHGYRQQIAWNAKRSQLRPPLRRVGAIRWGLPCSRTASTSASSPDAPAGMELLLFDRVDDSRPARVIPIDPQINRTYHYWHVFVPGVQARPDLWFSGSRAHSIRARHALRSVKAPPGSLRPRRRGSEELQPRRRPHARATTPRRQ